MKATTAIISIGLIVSILPVSGLPALWRDVLCTASGIVLVIVTLFFLRRESLVNQQMEEILADKSFEDLPKNDT